MDNGHTNLVPTARQRVLSRDYILRLCVVGIVLATCLVLAAGILLIPTHVYLITAKDTKASRLANINAALASGNETALSAQLMALASDASAMLALRDAPAVSSTTRAFLGVPRSGISLSGINYTSAIGAKPGTLVIAGTALTRDALRNYQAALGSASFSRGVDLPVSSYAKDTNIPFTITVTLVP